MDIAGAIWLAVFGIILGGGVLAGGIVICRFLYRLLKPED